MFGKKNTKGILKEQKTIDQVGQRILLGKNLPDTVAPSSIEVDFNFIKIGEKYYKTYFIVGYPRFVSPNWLSPLINFEHSQLISMYIYPSTSSDVLSDFRRKIAEME